MVTSHLGSVAQLVERSTENRKVTGSTPVGATTGKHQFFGTGAFLLLSRFQAAGSSVPSAWCVAGLPESTWVVAVQLSAKFDVGTQVGADVAVFILARSP